MPQRGAGVRTCRRRAARRCRACGDECGRVGTRHGTVRYDDAARKCRAGSSGCGGLGRENGLPAPLEHYAMGHGAGSGAACNGARSMCRPMTACASSCSRRRREPVCRGTGTPARNGPAFLRARSVTISAVLAPGDFDEADETIEQIRWWKKACLASVSWRCRAASSCKAGWAGWCSRSSASDGDASRVRRATQLRSRSRQRRSAASILNVAVAAARRASTVDALRSLTPTAAAAHRWMFIARRADGQAPVVVFFYGGSWQSGDKAMYRLCRRGAGAARLCDRGAGLSASIRKFAIRNFSMTVRAPCAGPKTMPRGSAAIAGMFFVMGHSAGAYIAAMLALDGRWLGNVGLAPGSRYRRLDRHCRAL